MTNSIESRFYITNVGKRPSNNSEEGPLGTVTMQAASKGPNDWSQWTPSGKIELATLNPAATVFFDEHLGKDIGVLFFALDEDGNRVE